MRKYGSNLRTSVQRDWEDAIDEAWVRAFLDINKTDRTYAYGWRVVEFIGIDDPQKARWPRRDILYCNEANELTYEDYRQLAMRTRYKIFIDFNPDDEDIWINTELEQKRALTKWDVNVIVSTYLDNPFLGQEIIEEIEHLRETDPIYWQVYGLGQYWRLEGRIFDFHDIDEVPKEAHLLGRGLDFGYSNDPTAIIAVYRYGDALVLDEEVYEAGMLNQHISDRLSNIWARKSDDIYADSSEPKSIDEIALYGWNIYPAEKGPDSVRFGIDLMKQYKIYITARSLNLRKEGRKYIWKKDKNGKSLNVPIDGFNHAIDAARYLIMSKLRKEIDREIIVLV